MRRTLAATAAGSMLAMLPLSAALALPVDAVAAVSFSAPAPAPIADTAPRLAAQAPTTLPGTPFTEQRFDVARRHRHRLAYVALAGGAALTGASFAITRHADGVYDRYLAATDPADAGRLYDATRRWDQLSTGTLLAGESLIVAGLWLRFLKHDPAHGLSLGVAPDRCAVSLSF